MEGDNSPERDHLVLPAGIQKVSYERDQKMTNAVTFTIHLEDHTVGNLLRKQLLEDPHVLFAAYKVPHPLRHYITVKVQTSHEDPVAAMLTAIQILSEKLSVFDEKFEEALRNFS